MPVRPQVSPQVPRPLVEGLEGLRRELAIPADFPPGVHAAAARAAASPRLPEADRTDLAFVTIDPEGSRDLDQAVFIQRSGTGFTVWYAIADVAAFVGPADELDREAHRRGQTLYAPHQRIPLYPPRLSEDAASLLPARTRPAVLWQLTLDERGALTECAVSRALVRSRHRLSYEQVQRWLDEGRADESLRLLRTVGSLREGLERERGGVNLRIPEQEVEADGRRWRIVHRSMLPVEGWNSQISLLTGMAAARIMLAAGVGLLRTLPPADEVSLRRLRETAGALRIPWPEEVGYPQFVRALDPARNDHAAMLYACTLLFRGAGYTAFNGCPPRNSLHAALASHYSHVTAPLRRLVDRYASEICVAVCAGEPVPGWVTEALAKLPGEMEASNRRTAKYESGIVARVGTLALSARVGEEFTAVVIEVNADGDKGRFMMREPVMEAGIEGEHLRLGREIRVRLVAADITTGQSRFDLIAAGEDLHPGGS